TGNPPPHQFKETMTFLRKFQPPLETHRITGKTLITPAGVIQSYLIIRRRRTRGIIDRFSTPAHSPSPDHIDIGPRLIETSDLPLALRRPQQHICIPDDIVIHSPITF